MGYQRWKKILLSCQAIGILYLIYLCFWTLVFETYAFLYPCFFSLCFFVPLLYQSLLSCSFALLLLCTIALLCFAFMFLSFFALCFFCFFTLCFYVPLHFCNVLFCSFAFLCFAFKSFAILQGVNKKMDPPKSDCKHKLVLQIGLYCKVWLFKLFISKMLTSSNICF